MIEDDSKEMLRILQSEMESVSTDYLLSKAEGEKVVDNLKYKLDGDKLKDMYASNSRRSFARNLLESCIEPVVRSRKKIYLPSPADYVRGLKNVLEKNSETEQNYDSNVSAEEAQEFYQIGNNYFYGLNGYEQDRNKARDFYIKSAYKGSWKAKNQLKDNYGYFGKL